MKRLLRGALTRTFFAVVLVLMMILRPQGLLDKREFSLSRLWERLTAMMKKPVPAGGKGEE